MVYKETKLTFHLPSTIEVVASPRKVRCKRCEQYIGAGVDYVALTYGHGKFSTTRRFHFFCAQEVLEEIRKDLSSISADGVVIPNTTVPVSRNTLAILTRDVLQSLEDFGGCDHSVGICACREERAVGLALVILGIMPWEAYDSFRAVGEKEKEMLSHIILEG